MAILDFLGSTSSDFESDDLPDNPLPQCPDSPNCVRLGRSVSVSANKCYDICRSSLDIMNPEKVIHKPEELRIESVFRVFLFRDDFTLQIAKSGKHESILYIRSASRVGFSDLWVNERRVQKFLDTFYSLLKKTN